MLFVTFAATDNGTNLVTNPTQRQHFILARRPQVCIILSFFHEMAVNVLNSQVDTLD